LFTKPDPEECSENENFTDNLNPDSLQTINGCLTESKLDQIENGLPFQLERIGYFCKDPDSNDVNGFILNRTVALRDSWGKVYKNK
jgi:glutaminyl-tRNA synthetase